MNNPSTSQKLQIGFSNTTEVLNLIEFNTLDDPISSGSWVSTSPLIVKNVVFSDSAIRQKMILTVIFHIPVTTAGTMSSTNFV